MKKNIISFLIFSFIFVGCRTPEEPKDIPHINTQQNNLEEPKHIFNKKCKKFLQSINIYDIIT